MDVPLPPEGRDGEADVGAVSTDVQRINGHWLGALLWLMSIWVEVDHTVPQAHKRSQ